MLKKIYMELVAIKKELQSIRRAMEFLQNPLIIHDIDYQLGRYQTNCDHACFATSNVQRSTQW